jgi:hypothetical protein
MHDDWEDIGNVVSVLQRCLTQDSRDCGVQVLHVM